MLRPNEVLQNRYRIIRELGKGGMGAVYEALDQRLHLSVALKETFSSDEELGRAFFREARMLANLHHSGLPKVTDYFIEGERQFLVMQFISGLDLKVKIQNHGSLFPTAVVMDWADQLLSVLEYLHQQTPPVIHRDIKPTNIKVTEQGQLFLIDFGIAKGGLDGTTNNSSERSIFAYSHLYSPLEQIQGETTDNRSDIYSTGATLYYLLTGTAPTNAITRAMTMAEGKPDPLKPAHTLNAQVSVFISNVLKTALELTTERRFESATTMRQALKEAANLEDEIPLPKPTIENLQRIVATWLDKGGKEEGLDDLLDGLEEALGIEAFDKVAEYLPLIVNHELLARQVQPTETGHRRFDPEKQIAESKAPVDMPSPDAALEAFQAYQEKGREGLLEVIVKNEREVEQKRKAQELATEDIPLFGEQQTNISGLTDKLEERRRQDGFVLILDGEFIMGSENGEANEKPVHNVKISSSFEMSKYQVTQEQWEAVMGYNPSHFKGANLPVEVVSWNDIQEFIKRLNIKNDNYIYRLPTEAEWEYACRAGNIEDYAEELDEMAWFSENSEYKTHPVGQKRPNDWGLYDMHGNVGEWCSDWYSDEYYANSPEKDPKGPIDSSYNIRFLTNGLAVLVKNPNRVIRGGGYYFSAKFCGSAFRFYSYPVEGYRFTGFRLVRIPHKMPLP